MQCAIVDPGLRWIFIPCPDNVHAFDSLQPIISRA
jgi:hypothetical protein